jgi:hypothetical protein
MWHFILCQERSSGINTKVGLLWHKNTDLLVEQGPMILEIFSPKNSAKKLAFLTQNKVNYAKF